MGITDDQMIISTSRDIDLATHLVLSHAQRWGVDIQPKKWISEGTPTPTPIWSGVMIDVPHRRLHITDKTVTKTHAKPTIMSKRTTGTRRGLQSLRGSLGWIFIACPMARAFVYDIDRAIAACSASLSLTCHFNPHFHYEISVLKDLITENRGAPFNASIDRRGTIYPILQDASGWGAGGYTIFLAPRPSHPPFTGGVSSGPKRNSALSRAAPRPHPTPRRATSESANASPCISR